MNQVRDLQQQAGKLVGDTDAEQRKQIAAQLDSLRQRLAGEGLGDVVTADDTAAALQRSLDDLQSGLSKVNDALWAAVSTADLSLNELISRHRLLHGHTVEALRLRAGGSPMLAMPELASENRSPDAVDDVQYDYSSQAARTVAERVIETAAASLATSAEVSGAEFAGAGVAAMSVAMSYNQANASDTDRFGRTGATQATHIQTHYHRSPQRQIDLNARHLRFSDDAAGELAAIATADPAEQPERAERFLRAFGSHVFTTLTLGGWYKHTATAEAQTLVQDTQLSDAVATAMDAAVSASASYSGLASAVSASAGAATTQAATSADARRQNYTINNITVTVTVKNNGGMEGLPLDYWISSVQYAPQWAVIDRDDPQPIWDIVEHAAGAQLSQQLGLEPAAVTALARLLEQTWVTQVFLPSLDTVDVALRRIVAAAAPSTARQLADVLGAAVTAMNGRIAITTSSLPLELLSTRCAGAQSTDFDGGWTVPVRTLGVRADGDKLTGLVWDHFDDHHNQMANANGPDVGDFTFQPGETLTKFTIYVVEYGGVAGGVPCGLGLTTSTGRTSAPPAPPVHRQLRPPGRRPLPDGVPRRPDRGGQPVRAGVRAISEPAPAALDPTASSAADDHRSRTTRPTTPRHPQRPTWRLRLPRPDH